MLEDERMLQFCCCQPKSSEDGDGDILFIGLAFSKRLGRNHRQEREAPHWRLAAESF